MTDLEHRLSALEAAVAELRALQVQIGAPPPAGDPDEFWLLQEVRQRHPAGAVVFGGTAGAGKGEVAWQWGVPSDRLLEQDWQPAAAALAALSHPVRLQLLQRVLNGAVSTAELSDDPSLGTTGQLHHHLRALVAGGWLHSIGRGQWEVLPQRVIPLLVVVAATTS